MIILLPYLLLLLFRYPQGNLRRVGTVRQRQFQHLRTLLELILVAMRQVPVPCAPFGRV